MRKCIRCGDSHDNKKICNSCLSIWSNMRGLIWDAMMMVHGSFNPSTQKEWIKEIKRLEAIWRKNKAAFEKEIELIKLEKGLNNE